MTRTKVLLFQTGFYLLKRYGMLSEGEVNFKKIFFISMVWLLNICFSVGHIISMIGSKHYEVKSIIEDLSISISVCFGLVVNITCAVLKNELISAYEDAGNFSVFPKPINVEKFDKIINSICKALYFYITTTTIVVLIYYIILYRIFYDCPDHVEIRCGLLNNVGLSIDIFYSPVREIICSLQILSCLWCMFNTLIVVILRLHCTEIITIRLKHLRNYIKEIQNLDNYNRKEYLIKCIKLHQELIRLSNRFNELSAEVIFVGFLALCAIIGLLTCSLLLEVTLRDSVHILPYIILTSLLAHTSERLMHNSSKLSEDIFYSIPWDGDCAFQKTLLIMMMRSQKELYLDVILVRYSYPLLLSILQTIYSIINMVFNFR